MKKLIVVVLVSLLVSVIAYGSGWYDAGSVVRLTTSTDIVGIGTNSPASKLHLHTTSGNCEMRLTTDATTYSHIYFGTDRDGSLEWGHIGLAHNGGNKLLKIAATGNIVTSNHLNIKENGNVGIGTTSPVDKLDVNGIVKMSGFKLTTGSPGDGDVLTYNGTSGEGEWRTISGGGGSCLWDEGSGDNIYYNEENGNVGIGTTSPKHNLEVEGTIETDYLYPSQGDGTPYRYLRFGDNSKFWAGFMWNYNGVNYGDGDDFSIYTYDNRDITFYTGTGNIIMFPSSGGNVGIGTNDPTAKLNVVGDIRIPYDNRIYFGGPWIQGYQVGGGYGGLKFYGNGGGEDHLGIAVDASGRVGIATDNPQSELAVNGTITAKEIIVTLDGWSDFVFANNYRPMPLNRLEKYIKRNKSLPGIPKEKEVLKGGVNLGDMQAKLLAKVEELTLYVINQNKEISELRKENEELKTRISALER